MGKAACVGSAPMDRLLSRKDLQEIFAVDVSTLRRWEDWGILRPLRIGHRTVRYRQSDVEAAIRAAEVADGSGDGGSGPERE